MSENPGNEHWRERIRKYGKRAVELEEMLRLGFWPPDEATAARRDQVLAELKELQQQIATARKELAAVEGKISTASDIEAIIADIRKRRIERVRAEREQRRQQKSQEKEEQRAADRQRRHERPPFLGHGVSAGLRYEGGDDARLGALGLPVVHTAGEIAAAIGIDEATLAWLTYHRGATTVDHYRRFNIPKRNGGTRVISSPKSKLRVAQGWVLRAILSGLPLHDAAMAFRPARSIVANAALHQGRAIVVRIDLKDFFPSIGFARVRGLFESFGYNEGVATILALLTTEAPRLEMTLDGVTRYVAIGERQLPQGACTSPAITNILCRGLDARLSGLARRFGFTYSRYADDLVFSHPNPAAALGSFLRGRFERE
jgi:RNA-directed DNA polymerase